MCIKRSHFCFTFTPFSRCSVPAFKYPMLLSVNLIRILLWSNHNSTIPSFPIFNFNSTTDAIVLCCWFPISAKSTSSIHNTANTAPPTPPPHESIFFRCAPLSKKVTSVPANFMIPFNSSKPCWISHIKPKLSGQNPFLDSIIRLHTANSLWRGKYSRNILTSLIALGASSTPSRQLKVPNFVLKFLSNYNPPSDVSLPRTYNKSRMALQCWCIKVKDFYSQVSTHIFLCIKKYANLTNNVNETKADLCVCICGLHNKLYTLQFTTCPLAMHHTSWTHPVS